jgi:Isochorismate synthase
MEVVDLLCSRTGRSDNGFVVDCILHRISPVAPRTQPITPPPLWHSCPSRAHRLNKSEVTSVLSEQCHPSALLGASPQTTTTSIARTAPPVHEPTSHEPMDDARAATVPPRTPQEITRRPHRSRHSSRQPLVGRSNKYGSFGNMEPDLPLMVMDRWKKMDHK